MLQQHEHTRPPASFPSRHDRPRRDCYEGSRSRRAFHPNRRLSRRGSECRKSLLTPGSDRVKKPDRGGPLFDAQYTSSDTGLIYMRARVYDPATAQFLTVDPLKPVTQAPYSYAGDNPLNYLDRTGLSSCSIVPGSSENCFSEVSGAIGSVLESAAEHPVEAGGVVLGGVAIASGVGEVVVGGTVVGEGTLGAISAISGGAAAGVDAKACAAGSGISCVGAGVGAVASGGAGAVAFGAVTGTTAAGTTAISLTAGGIGFLSDVAGAVASFNGKNSSTASGCG